VHLGPHHEEAAILCCADRALQRRVEARPAGAAFELGIRGEQFLAAAGADELAVPLLLVQRTGSGALGAVLAQHLVLSRRQLRAPLLVRMRDGKGLRLRLVRSAEQPLHPLCLRFGFCDHMEYRVPDGGWGGWGMTELRDALQPVLPDDADNAMLAG